MNMPYLFRKSINLNKKVTYIYVPTNFNVIKLFRDFKFSWVKIFKRFEITIGILYFIKIYPLFNDF